MTLAAQALTTAQDLNVAVQTLVPSARRYFIQATSQQALQLDLARCLLDCRRMDVVAICGHSNQNGLRLTGHLDVSWDALARWIAPFKPKYVVLVACQGGRWLPSKALFEGIPRLLEIYGSPALITDQQAAVMKLLIPYLLMSKRLQSDVLQLGQLANFLFTGGVLFRQTRKNFKQTGLTEGLAWTALEELLKKALG